MVTVIDKERSGKFLNANIIIKKVYWLLRYSVTFMEIRFWSFCLSLGLRYHIWAAFHLKVLFKRGTCLYNHYSRCQRGFREYRVSLGQNYWIALIQMHGLLFQRLLPSLINLIMVVLMENGIIQSDRISGFTFKFMRQMQLL